jgi:hypothetical protein
MANSGRWSQQKVYKNCGNNRCQRGCAEDSAAKPHGPYAQLRRRNPDNTNQQDSVYLGKQILSQEALAFINENFTSASVPTREEIVLALESE